MARSEPWLPHALPAPPLSPPWGHHPSPDLATRLLGAPWKWGGLAGTLGDTEWGAPRAVSTAGCPRELGCYHERSWLWGASRPSLPPRALGTCRGSFRPRSSA